MFIYLLFDVLNVFNVYKILATSCYLINILLVLYTKTDLKKCFLNYHYYYLSISSISYSNDCEYYNVAHHHNNPFALDSGSLT